MQVIYLKYFKIAKEVYINNKIIKIFEDVDDIKYNITEMIKKYNELKSDVKKDLDKLVNDKSYTLGALLNNIYAKRNLDSDLLTLLKCMFDAKELNLRNDIIHCNTYKPYDPFDFPITMIFFHLLILISYEIFDYINQNNILFFQCLMIYIYYVIKLFKQYLLPFTPTKTMLQKTLKRQRDIRKIY